MAAPSAPVIQNVSTAYWFGSNVRAEWVTLIDVTSCAATLTLPDGTTQSVMVNSSQIDAYTTQWVARPAPASVGRYVLSVTATNADGTSDAGTATFMVIDYPVMVISPADGSTVTGLPLDLSWVISDSTGIATQRIRITDSGGATIYSIEPNNNIRTLSLGVAELAGIEDGASYTIWLDMTNGVGLSMSAHSTVTTSWLPPVTPTATVSTDPDTLAASVTVTAGEATSATNIGEFFAHSLTDSSYWYSTSFASSMTAAGNGWAHFTYTNSGSSWSWINISPKAVAVSLTASSTYTYMAEVKNITGSIRVNAPATSGTASVWTEGKTADFTTDSVVYLTATTLADMSSATQVRTYLGVPANTTVTCDIRLSLYAGEYDGPYVPYGTPATDTLMVVRVSPDGTRHVLADDLESGDTVTDPLPPLGVEYSYEVTGIAATGVPSTPATVAHTNATTCWAMNFGTGAAEVVLARFNPKASYSVEQGGEAYHFADGGEGDGLPVWYPTTEREISGADTWDTLTHATADRLNALMLRYPVGWLRDPFGHRWRARMKPKFSHGIGKLWQVSIDWDAVRWVEA